VFEIYAYQNSDSLFGIFNAVAAIMGSGTYASALAAVAFCGFLAALAAYAFAPEKLQGWKWILTVVLVFSVLLVPKVTIGIVDKTGGAPVKVVANVPLGLAALGGLTSAIGNTLTELFETAFQVVPGPGQLSADFTYQKNGLLFGNRLVRDSGSITIADAYLRADLINFIGNCTQYDLADGTLSASAFAAADDVWPLMGTPNPARFTTIASPGGLTNVTCTDAYASIDARLPAEVVRLQDLFARKQNPTLPPAAAAAALVGQIQQAYLRNQIAVASGTAAEIIRQNALLNAIRDSGKLVGQKINDPGALTLGMGQAMGTAQQNASWLAGAKVAEQALPIFRNVIEAMTYAMFPLVVLLLLLTSGPQAALIMKSYAVILVWIQLWPPLYAILNYMATIYAQFDLAAAAEIGGARVLALQTSSPIYNNAVSAEAVVGYLVTAIPFIAWAAVKRMETFGTAIAGGMNALTSTVGMGTAAAAVGNVGLGNVTMDQRSISPSTSNPWVSREQQLSGDWFTYDGTGRTAVEKLANRGFASRRVEFRVSEQDVAEANRSTESARAEMVAASTERAAALADVYTRAWNRVQDSRSQTGTSQSAYEEVAKDLSDVNRAAEDIAARSGASQAQVARALMHLGLGKAILPAGGGLEKTYQSQLSHEDQRILGYATQQQISAAQRFGDRVTRDRSFVSSIAMDDREANELSARLNSTAARSNRAEANYSERVAVAQRMSAARSKGEAISIDIAQDPYNTAMFRKYTEQYGNSAAALVMMQAELARQALGPTHVYGDGTPAFTTPEAVRGSFERNVSNDLSLNPDVGASAASARNDVKGANRSFGHAPKPGGWQGGTETLRQHVDDAERALKQDTAAAKGRQQSAAPVETNTRGTMFSKKSLLKQVDDQTGEDVTQAGEAVSRVIDGARSRLLPKRGNDVNPRERN